MDTSESLSYSTSTSSSTSASSIHSNSSTATKTPGTNVSRILYPTSPITEGQYNTSQYLFVTPSSDGSTAPSSAVSSAVSILFPSNTQTFSSNSAHALVSPSLNVFSPTGAVTPSHPGTPSLRSNALPGGQAQTGNLSAARGMTSYLLLKDHSISFNFPLEAIVKMDVTRGGATYAQDLSLEGQHEGGSGGLSPHDPHSLSSGSFSLMMTQQQQGQKPNLHPSPFKLVVMQRVIPDDPSSVPQNPRLGAVYINLAEYVGKGKVERRFLLKESKVNATLKLSIEVTYLSGFTGYIPPLHKAEILGGIEGFLTQHETKKSLGALKVASTTRDRGSAKGRGKEEGEEGDGDDAREQEVEVDLLGRGLLEREKDRIGQGLLANMKLVGRGELLPEIMITTREEDGWEEGSVHPRESSDPYALPSDSESESEYDAEIYGDATVQEKSLTEEVLGRKRWKEDMKAQRREVRGMNLLLNESDGDDSLFESADEGYGEEEREEEVAAKETIVPGDIQHLRVSAFDIQSLPLAYGPKATESLIDALFNPSVTSDRESQGPFTFYVSPREIQFQQAMERESTREMEVHVRMQHPGQAMEQNQHPHHHRWYTQKRKMSRDTESSGRSSAGGGLKTKLRRGSKRGETMDSASISTSWSGSGESPGVRMKSPGGDTIVGMRTVGDGGDDPDATSPATVTGLSPTDGVHQRFGLGVNIEGSGSGAPSDRDTDGTIGKSAAGGTAGVGNFLYNYYRAKKGKGKGRAKKEELKERETERVYIMGVDYYEQEPQEMLYGQLGQGQAPTNVHKRRATSGTISSESGSSLSSLSLRSRSASGHGHSTGLIPGPPVLPQFSAAPIARLDVRRSSSVRSASTGDSHVAGAVLPSIRSRQPDLSVPDGRMDKMGVVKGSTSPTILSMQESEETGGFGSSLKGWWKGLQR